MDLTPSLYPRRDYARDHASTVTIDDLFFFFSGNMNLRTSATLWSSCNAVIWGMLSARLMWHRPRPDHKFFVDMKDGLQSYN